MAATRKSRNADWQDKCVLVTGGTGSFGQAFVDLVLREKKPRKLVVLSRDELKQHEMRARFPDNAPSAMRYFIGDVRDKDRLERAFHGIDYVVHAAALKQVPACEYNPFEAVLTNVMGAKNVIDAAIDQGVERVVALSTDKAVAPVNLYGATKLCAEKLFVQGNSYVGSRTTRFSVVRYGNVVGSRGSVVPLFREQRKAGEITITDPRMTRFWITVQEGAQFVADSLDRMHGGEIFVPKIPSMRIADLAKVMAPECKVKHVGIRPGEKMDEVLVSEDESRHTVEMDGMYVVQPQHPWWSATNWNEAKQVPSGFSYRSDTNDGWITPDELRRLVA